MAVKVIILSHFANCSLGRKQFGGNRFGGDRFGGDGGNRFGGRGGPRGGGLPDETAAAKKGTIGTFQGNRVKL